MWYLGFTSGGGKGSLDPETTLNPTDKNKTKVGSGSYFGSHGRNRRIREGTEVVWVNNVLKRTEKIRQKAEKGGKRVR